MGGRALRNRELLSCKRGCKFKLWAAWETRESSIKCSKLLTQSFFRKKVNIFCPLPIFVLQYFFFILLFRYQTSSCSVTVYLNAGSSVYVQLIKGSLFGHSYLFTTFSGHRLHWKSLLIRVLRLFKFIPTADRPSNAEKTTSFFVFVNKKKAIY